MNSLRGDLPPLSNGADFSIGDYPVQPTMLETMYIKEMKALLRSSSTVAFIAVSITILEYLIVRYKSVSSTAVQMAPTYLLILELVLSASILVTASAVTVHYTRRIFRIIPTNRTVYQLATLCLLICLLPTFIPTRAISELVTAPTDHANIPYLMVDTLLQTVSSSGIIMYTLITVRACRSEHLQSGDVRALTTNSGNALVVMFVGLYALTRIVTSTLFKVFYAVLPFQNFISLLNILSAKSDKVPTPEVIAPICILTAFELVLALLLYRGFTLTSAFLASADQIEYRTEAITHRFFKMSSGALLIPMGMIAVLQFGYPTQQSSSFYETNGDLILSPAVGGAAVGLIFFFFASRQAYVNLPSDTDGVADWIIDQAKNVGPGKSVVRGVLDGEGNSQLSFSSVLATDAKKGATPLTYRGLDARDPDRGLPKIDPTSFSLESAALMFNFSWLVYTYGTTGFTASQPRDFGRSEYRVVKHIRDSECDLHAIIVDGPDRISIAFKGSNSVANAVTDKDFKMIKALNAFKGMNSPAAKALPGFHLHGDASDWKGCKLHSGYALAYANIRVALMQEISDLFQKKRRPIFVCGHSSGGAYATLCSFELATLDVLSGPEFISVYTFGAPQCGNEKFVSAYDDLVKSHWRCVVAGDSTVNLPRYGPYRHTGKMAMFTRHGHLTLEKIVQLRWWQSQTSSHPMYKLTSYYCAMACWGQSHSRRSPDDIGLWKWPLDKVTSRLFSAHAEEGLEWDVENPSVTAPTPVAMTPMAAISTRSIAYSAFAPGRGQKSRTPGSPANQTIEEIEKESLEDVVAFSK